MQCIHQGCRSKIPGLRSALKLLMKKDAASKRLLEWLTPLDEHQIYIFSATQLMISFRDSQRSRRRLTKYSGIIICAFSIPLEFPLHGLFTAKQFPSCPPTFAWQIAHADCIDEVDINRNRCKICGKQIVSKLTTKCLPKDLSITKTAVSEFDNLP